MTFGACEGGQCCHPTFLIDVCSWQGLYTLFVVGLLLTNALAVLHEKRFLVKGSSTGRPPRMGRCLRYHASHLIFTRKRWCSACGCMLIAVCAASTSE